VDELDFELELIHRDEVNVFYILKLLAQLQQQKDKEGESESYQQTKKSIIDLLGKETQLRSKRELIEKFINEYMPTMDVDADMDDEFEQYWTTQRKQAVKGFAEQENMDEQALLSMIDEYHFSGKTPLRETVFSALNTKPKLMERKTIFERIVDKLTTLIETFDDI
jgi:type I restriction enzyme R subunit